jgi:glutamine synthetase type III
MSPDHKLPLLKSEKSLNTAVLRLLKLHGVAASAVYPMLAIEQQYYVVDPTFLGEPVLKEPTPAFMKEVEEAISTLGIFVKAYPNTVVLPFEKASLAMEHHLQLMEVMQKLAIKHDLACLFSEKPFKKMPGLEKRIGWSLITDTGLNLLEQNGPVSRILCGAIKQGAFEHADLLWASVASRGNDLRLKELEGKNLLVFSGSKVEFLAAGVSSHLDSFALLMNAIVADSLQLILDEGKEPTFSQDPFFLKGNYKKSPYAFKEWIHKKSIRVLDGILTEAELLKRYEIFLEEYVTIASREVASFKASVALTEIKKIFSQMNDLGPEAKAKVFCELILPRMDQL